MYINTGIGVLLGIIIQTILIFTGKKIDYEYYSKFKLIPIIVNSLLIGLFFYKYGISNNTLIVAIVISISVSSSFIDLKYQEIPDSYNLATFLLGILYMILNKPCYEILLIGGAVIFIFFFILMIISGALGGGDVKMAGALGLFLGSYRIIEFLIGSFFIGSLISIIIVLFMNKSKKDVIAFGPSIALSAIFILLTV